MVKRRWLSLLLVLALLLSAVPAVGAAAKEPVMHGSITLQCGQTEARSMLAMVNAFRKSDEAWAWNQTSTEKIYYPDLPELTYDYTLEKIAMQRAAEIALRFAHERPNGQRCFSLKIDGVQSYAENIAAGYPTAAAAFEGWKETDELYEGQGHRRNMLDSERLHIGIGHVVMNGVHFWVQELGFYNSNAAVTLAEDGEKAFPMEVLPRTPHVQENGLQPAVSSLELTTGQEAPAPAVQMAFQNTAVASWKGTMELQPNWTAADSGIVTVEGGIVRALRSGQTLLKATIGGQTVSVPVQVGENAAYQVAGVNMTLGNALSMNFMVKKADIPDRAGFSMKITKHFADGRAPVTVTVPAESWTNYNRTYYAVPFDDISAKEMTDTITAVLLRDGVPAGKVYTDSVEGYAIRLLRGGSASAELKAVTVDMLNYGAAAQRKLHYNENCLANARLTAQEQALASDPVAVTDIRQKGPGYYGSNLNLGSNMALTLFFENIGEDARAVVSYTKHTGEHKTCEIPGRDFVKFNSRISGVRVDTLVVADAGQPVTVTVYGPDGSVIGTAVDSIESYTARAADLGELGDAIMKFSVSAKTYFESTRG